VAAIDVVRSLQGLQRQQPPGPSSLPFVDTIVEDPQPQPDGTTRFTTALIPSPGNDLAIPIGTWTLLLLNRDGAGTAKVPVSMFFAGPGQPNPGEFRRIEVDLARFELIADPSDLVPADLVADPYVHLVPNQALAPVRLLGPGLTVILRGEGLTDVSARFTGANGGADERFPSARFSPPHFLLGATENFVGVACDEVMLDLSSEIDPDNLDDLTGTPGDGTFEGVILQELGIFIGDPEEVGTWSGMARVHGFVLRFDPVELTGTFEGELVHAVAPDDPQVAVVVSWVTDSGQRVNVDEVDPTIPAPLAPEVARRVRLVATPNWASVGFQATWTVPKTVEPEDGERVNQPDLGWVRVPPGAHTFTIVVTDHRVDPVTATRTVIVQAPPTTPTTPPLEVDLVASIPHRRASVPRVLDPTPGSSALHLYAPLRPRQPVVLQLDAKGGTGDALTAGCALPPEWTVIEPRDQTATRLPSGEFQRLTWTLTTPDAPSEGSVTVAAVLGAETAERRLRYTLRPPLADGEPDLELIAQTDWRPETGAAAALSMAHDGLDYGSVRYHLASTEAPAELLSGAAHDDLFAEDSPAFTDDAEVPLASTGGVVEPELPAADRLYRLAGEVRAGPGVQPPSVVVLPETIRVSATKTTPARTSKPLQVDEVKALIPPDGRVAFFRSNGFSAGPIRFAFDRFEVPPTSPINTTHDPGTTLESLEAEQAQGFANTLRAVDEAGDRIAKLGLFASASTEGPDDYNLGLSSDRLEAAKRELRNPSAGLRQAIARLPDEHRVDTELIDRAAARIRDLPSDKLVEQFWGEANYVSDDLPFDRRVFAVIQLDPPPDTAGFRRRTYFLVRAGAPVTPTPVRPRLPKPDEHPFRHSIFRSAHVELELRRNELLRFQIRLELDLERFDENDLDPPGQLNPSDGIVTGFLELRRNPDPAASPRFAWELDLLADPTDVDGLLAFVKGGTLSPIVEIFGGPLIAMPAMAAAAGGEVGPSGLLVALGVGTFLQQVGVFDVQTVVWRGLRLRLQHGGARATRFSIALDYSVKYDIDVDLTQLGLPLRMETTSPIEVTFRNVGVEVVGSFDGVSLFYDPSSGFAVDVGDPGVFLLGDGLGRLLRVDRVALGDASPLWLEVELGFALDTGVFSVDTLRVRLSLEGDTVLEPDENGVVHLDESALDLDDLRLTINKLGVTVDVPGVLAGSGVLGIKEDASGTTVEGGLALDFQALPVLRGLEGRMRLFTSGDLRALYLALGVEFSPGLALGSTGVAVYGLHGLLGANMAPSRPDPLDWLRQPPVGVTSEAKWMAARGAWAFGAGATLGTVFDDGFSLNLSGTLLLLLPGPRFVLAAHAEVLSPRSEPGEVRGVLATVTLDLENDLITAGFDRTVSLAGLLELRVPAEAFFDLRNATNFYLRFGQWAPESKRITLRIFGLFEAWGYLQLEGRGLHNGALDLDGIVVGAGARIEITWGVKRVLYLEAFAEAHAGIQLAPLYFEGLIRVGGTLHAGPFSIGADGELHAKVRVLAPRFLVLEGKVCGSIDLWFTTLTKCARFELGDGDRPTPRPDNPFTEAVAIDRATGLPIEEAAGEVVVPIDAVFHATFTADIRDRRLPPGISFATDPSVFRNQVSDALFYEFDLTALAVRPVGGADLAGVTSAWAPYTLVEAGSAPPSQRTLRVMDWKPTAHPRQVDFGSAVESALAVLVRALCDPIVPPPRQCVDFDEEPLGHRSVWLLDHGELPPVRVMGPSSSLGAEASFAGGQAQPARVVGLVDADYPGRRPKAHCLHLGKPAKGTPLQNVLDLVALDADPVRVKERADKLLGTVDEVIGGGPLPDELQAPQQAGVVVVRLPSLVALDVVVVVPRTLELDLGELTVLDAELEPLAGPVPIGTLPPVPGGVVGGTVANHIIRRFSFGDPLPAPAGTDPPTARWLVLRPPGEPVVGAPFDDGSYLLELCGVTLTAWREFARAHQSVRETIEQLTTLSGLVAGEPALLGQPLLVPGTRYELAGTMDWARYRSRGDSDPDGTSAEEGGPLPVQSRQFLADPLSPRDLTRYVRDHDPFDQDQPHYTDEPLLLRYASAAVDRIYAAYGEQLVIRAKSDAAGHTLVQPTAATAGTTFAPMGPVEEELLRALDAVRDLCLPGIWVHLFPRSLHTVRQPLLPNNAYTVSVLARPQSEPGPLTAAAWEGVLEEAFEAGAYVYRFDLRTSRWPSFAGHVAAYAAAPVGDLLVEAPDALAAVLAGLPGDPVLRGDAEVDAVCAAVAGGPVVIPDRPEVLRLWLPEGPGWRCAGLLLDGPEPLLRRRLRADGGLEDRVTVDARSTTSPAVPFDLGAPLTGLRVVAGRRGARVFVLFEPPPAADDLAVVLRLHDRGPSTETAPAGDHDLAVAVGAVPAVLVEVGS
jgi:hypothetical protein